jgi:murein DD-endopeptidase MepM/ murein hydrolase activator NlpD
MALYPNTETAMALPLILAGAALTVGIIGVAASAYAYSDRKAAFVLDQGRFVRGLDMNRRTRDGRLTPHWGIDLGAPTGTPVHALKSGVVVFSRPLRGYGNTVMISHRSDGKSSLYGHLHQANVREGQEVAGGDVIGLVGGTRHGRNARLSRNTMRYESVGQSSTGAVSRPISPHLHMEVHPTSVPLIGPRPRRLDPVQWLAQEGIEQYARRWDREGTDRVA